MVMDADEIVERVEEASERDRIHLVADGVSVWMLADGDRARLLEATEDAYGWDEGEFYRPLRPLEDEEERLGLVMPAASVISRTEKGDWERPTLTLAERWPEGVDGPEDADMPWNDWGGESREVQSVTVIPSEMWEYREQALDESYSLRATALRRAIWLDAAARYAASEQTCDVWWEYEEEAEEPSLSGFITWLEVETLRQLWDEVGKQMFVGEDEGVVGVGDRALADTLSTLRYFHSS